MLDPALATLSTDQKLDLIGELWDSITADGQEPPVTDEEVAYVEGRMKELEKPYTTTEWGVLKKELGY